MTSPHPIAKILVDAFNEAGVNTDGFGFYDMMAALWLAGEEEAYNMIVKALSNEVITNIKEMIQ